MQTKLVLVERERELQALADLMAGCERDGGRVALVRGAMATGKTTLLRAFGERAAGAGVRVLHATGSTAENGVALGVISQLLRQPALKPVDTDEIVRHLDAAADAVTGMTADPGFVHHAPPWPVQQLFDVVVEQIRCAPVLIGVDDAQYADVASLQFLSYLLRRLAGLPALVVLTESTGPNRLPVAFRAELLRHPRVSGVRLAPLSADGVAAMLLTHLDAERARQLAPSCHAVSGGNPLLVRSFAEDHRSEAHQRTEPGIGEAFTQAVLACVYPGEPAVFHVACGLAVLGDQATEALVARLVDTTVESVARVVRALSAAGLVEASRFRHPALASAVIDHLPARDRADLHGRAAGLLHDAGAAMIAVAHHLIAAGPVDFPWACAALREAADEALRDDVELALQCLQAAHRIAPDDRERAAITVARIDIEWRKEPQSADRWLASLVAEVQDGRLVGREAARVVRHLVWHGRTREAASALASLAATSGAEEPDVAAEFHGIHQWLRYWCPPLATDTVARPSTAPRADLRQLVASQAQAAGLLGLAFTRGADDQLVSRAEEVLHSTPLSDTTIEPLLSALQVLIYADRSDMALPWCDTLLTEAATRRASTWQALLSSVRAEIAIRQGDLTTAERLARAALQHISTRGWGVAIGAPLACLVQANTMLGMKCVAASWLNHPVPEDMFQTPFGLLYLHASGCYQLAAKRPAAAVEDFLTCGELIGKWELDLPAFLPWRTGAAQAYLDLGEVVKARTLVRDQLTRPGAALPRTKAISLRLLAAVSPPDRRPALLWEALDAVQNYGDRAEQVRVMADLSRALQELGVPDRARTMARRAWNMAKQGGTEALCRSLLPPDVRTTLGVVENSDSEVVNGSDTLTNSERPVAVLAAMGHTNREIARKLRITVSTVEQHLTRVYRKLNVRRRNELPTVLQMNTDDITGRSGVA